MLYTIIVVSFRLCVRMAWPLGWWDGGRCSSERVKATQVLPEQRVDDAPVASEDV